MKMTNERGKRIRDVSEPNFLYQTRNYFRSRAQNSATIEFDESEFPKPQFSEIGVQTDKIDEGYGSDQEQNKPQSGVNKMIEEKLRKQKLKEKSKPAQQLKSSPKTIKKIEEKSDIQNPPRKVIAPSITPGHSGHNAGNISTQSKPTVKPNTKPTVDITVPVTPKPVKPEGKASTIEQNQKPKPVKIEPEPLKSDPEQVKIEPKLVKSEPEPVKTESKSEEKLLPDVTSEENKEIKPYKFEKEEVSEVEHKIKIEVKPVIKPVNLGSLVSNTVNTQNEEKSTVKESSQENDPVADFKAIQAEDEKWMRQLKQKKQVQAMVIDVSKLSFEN